MKIIINNQFVDISHLKDITRTMTLDISRGNKQKKDARLEFRFSCHCYSRGPKEGEAIPPGLRIPDGSFKMPRDRIFCHVRYNLSLLLVRHIDQLIEENGLVHKSRHLNFFATQLVTSDEHGVMQEIPYYVFMMAKKKKDPNQPPKLDIYIESAYPDDPSVPAPVPKGGAMRLSFVLGEVWADVR